MEKKSELSTAVRSKDFIVVDSTIESRLKIANVIAKSQFCPPSFRGKSEDVLMAMWHGDSLGLSPLQAVQSIAVINSRPSLWGDALLAICRGSKLCKSIKEDQPTAQNGMTATCTVIREGEPEPIIRTFSEEDARKAHLLGKQGPWTTNPRRMLQLRARGFALRDAFPDLLNGLTAAEEMVDVDQNADSGDVVDYPMPRAVSNATTTNTTVNVNKDTGEITDVVPDMPEETPVPKEEKPSVENDADVLMRIGSAKTIQELRAIWSALPQEMKKTAGTVYEAFVARKNAINENK